MKHNPTKSHCKLQSSARLRVGRIRLVSLDVGNTLVTSSEPSLISMLARAAPPGVSLDAIAGRLHTCVTTQPLLNDICDFLGVRRIKMRDYRAPQPIVMPGVLQALTLLGSLNIRVVSLSNVTSLDALPLPKGVSEHLSTQYRSFELGAAKPSLAAFQTMLDREGISAHSCVHIGDSWRCDALGALAAGINAIWLKASSKAEVPLSNDRFAVVRSFREAVETLIEAIKDE